MYNAKYEYNVDKKTSKVTFYDNTTKLSSFGYNNSVITISAIDEMTVPATNWGTNKDIKEWFDCVYSMRGRLELVEGQMRDGYDYGIKVDDIGVTGVIEVNGETLGDWRWVALTNALTIVARIEQEINFAELRSFAQWMQHFQYCVQNYGG